jgi:hypothetical protein
MKITLLIAAVLALASPASAGPVTDAAGLSAELKAAQGGETITLATGDYGLLALANRGFAEPVTIASANPAKPARLSGVTFNGVANLRLVGLDIGRDRAADEPDWSRIVDIRGGSNLTFEGGSIHGSRDGDPSNDMFGMQANGTSRLTIRGVRFEELVRGAVIEKSSDIVIERSDFDLIRSDGVNIPGSARVRIVSNHMRRFRPIPAVYGPDNKLIRDGDHPDGVQGFTQGQESGVQDVLIADNLLEFEPMHRSQGFWFRDEAALWKSGRGHKRITIERNRIVSPNWQAIGVVEVEGARVIDNEVVNLPGGPPVPGGPVIPWIAAASTAELTGNTAPYFMIDFRLAQPANNQTVGRAIQEGRSAAVSLSWIKAFRTPVDPRLAEREALRKSIPADTVTRDAMTKKLAKDRARLKALDKALGV